MKAITRISSESELTKDNAISAADARSALRYSVGLDD